MPARACTGTEYSLGAQFTLSTGEVEVIDAVTFEAQLPLGMFGDTPYTVEPFQSCPATG